MNGMLASIVREAKASPISFAGSVVGIILAIYMAATAISSAFVDVSSIYIPNTIIIVRILSYILIQSAICSVFAKIFLFLSKKGHGFPIVWLLAGMVFSGWVLVLNGFLFAVTSESLTTGGMVLFASFFASTVIIIYFTIVTFSEVKRVFLSGSKEFTIYDVKRTEGFTFFVCISMGIIIMSFSMYYGAYLADEMMRMKKIADGVLLRSEVS